MTERRPHQLAERLLALGGVFITLMVLVGNFALLTLQLWLLLLAAVMIGWSLYLYSREEGAVPITVQIDQFHKTRLGYAVFGLVELALAFAAANWAIDNGSLWLWILAVIFLFGCLQNFVQVVVHKNE